jgi:hypothetical protein
MPDFSSSYRKFFTADDVRKEEKELTIIDVSLEEIQGRDQKQKRPIVHVKESELGLVLNKTNYEDLAELYGSRNTDKWVGNTFVAFFNPAIKFGGRLVGGISVRASE